jgi:uncharacterized DUF497 family protein
MKYVWDPRKARQNFVKHRIHFSELEPVFEDERALRSDEAVRGEERSILVGMDGQSRILVVVYTMDEDKIRIISARKADKEEQTLYGVR